jgi:hypothetical protein
MAPTAVFHSADDEDGADAAGTQQATDVEPTDDAVRGHPRRQDEGCGSSWPGKLERSLFLHFRRQVEEPSQGLIHCVCQTQRKLAA